MHLRLANHSAADWTTGWQRLTLDDVLPLDAMLVGDGVTIVPVHHLGDGATVCDVRAKLAAHSTRSVTETDVRSQPIPPDLGGVPPDLVALGGPPVINGSPLQLRSLARSGAGWALHASVRLGPLVHVEAWLRWYPDHPRCLVGEVSVTASRAGVSDLRAAVPPEGIVLRWGDAGVHTLGGWGAPIVPGSAGHLGDGQCWASPVVVAWMAQLGGLTEWQYVAQVADRTLCGIDADLQLWPRGNPYLPSSHDARAWSVRWWGEALRRAQTWEAPVESVAAASGQTGKQADQLFRGAEPFAANGVGAEDVLYLSALQQLRRPCHHLEADGRVVDSADHPLTMLWFSRAHMAMPDRLGKVAEQQMADTHGWNGPDNEHDLLNTLSAAALLTGSPALQRGLEHQAHNYLLAESLAPGWFTTSPGVPRAVGYACLKAVHLWRTLVDRKLAQRVRERCMARMSLYVAAFDGRPIWDVRTDARLELGPGKPGSMTWQQSLGAWGLDLAAELFGHEHAQLLALDAARAIVDLTWQQREDGAWIDWDNVTVPKPPTYTERDTAHRTGWFTLEWQPLAIDVLRRRDPHDKRAQEIWAHIVSLIGPTTYMGWIPPGSLQQ